MSTEQDKLKRNRRLQKDENAIKKQLKIAGPHLAPNETPHRFAKMHAMNCGDSDCAMCGNPRKFFDEKTIQEKSFEQTQHWNKE